MQHNKFWKSHSCPESQEIPHVYKAPRFTSSSTKLATCPYPEPDESSPRPSSLLTFILTLPSHLGQGLPFRFPHQNPIRIYILLYSTNTPYPLTSSVRTFLSLASSCFLPRDAPNIFLSQYLVLEHPQLCPSLNIKDLCTSIQNNRQISSSVYFNLYVSRQVKSEILMTLNWTVYGNRHCLI